MEMGERRGRDGGVGAVEKRGEREMVVVCSEGERGDRDDRKWRNKGIDCRGRRRRKAGEERGEESERRRVKEKKKIKHFFIIIHIKPAEI